ncbi:Golgi-associated RAB2 interactor protein 5A isoform X2 [Emydura macquarii macquarii]|uniref:Golgi-associated RAB2 interactor protein 5A isoform X2 n=1 Tax=Emydura macquarii macquarii TaxID=1129001 RepID=UPI00352A884B
MGQLQRCLARGEYGRLRECPLFESDFLQVTKSGDVASRVTLGIAATSRRLELPDLLLLARPVPPPVGAPAAAAAPRGCPPRGRSSSSLGRTFYLQLLAPPAQLERVFGQWVRLLYRLRFHLPGLGAGDIQTPGGGREAAGQGPPRNQTHRTGGGRRLVPSPMRVTPRDAAEQWAPAPNKR